MTVTDDETVTDPKLQDEAGRLKALHRYEVLDTPGEESFDRITGLVKTVMNVPMCSVSLIDSDRQWLKSCVGFKTNETARDISFCTHTIMDREPLLIEDALEDERFASNPLVVGDPFIRSYLGIPLCTPDGYNVGALCAIDTVPRTYSESQVEVMKSFAALVMDEMELRRIAQTDFLTGAVTRRGFTLELDKALAQFRRSGKSAALVMLDIDHFKLVNDTHGHPAGDVVLRTVAQRLTSQLRMSDVLGRLGGEEFGVLLPEMAMPEALETAERLRSYLAAAPVEHDPPIHVTASFGVAVVSSRVGSANEWLAAADEALYQSKRAGRNRVSQSRPAVRA